MVEGTLHLNSNANKKVITGKEFDDAEVTVAEVNLRPTLYRFKLVVILEPNEFNRNNKLNRFEMKLKIR